MKILHVITRLILGGAQQNTVMSCAAQVRAGHDVTLAFGPIYGPEGSLRDEAEASGAALVEIPSMVRALHPVKDPLCYLALRRLIRRTRPDVVHTHSSKAGIIARAAAWHERVPAVIHTVHGLAFHDEQPPHIHKLYVALEKYAAKRCHHLLAITPQMIDAFAEKHIAPRAMMTVVPSGVDFAKLEVSPNQRSHAKRELGIPQDAPVVALVARLDPLKGHGDLLDVLPALLEEHPDLRLLFIGDGWHRKELELRIEQEGLGEHVLMLGLVPHEGVTRLLAAADVKVLPSYQEGQSRTLIEALVAGCGIVAYNVGGMPSICLNGITGKLVPVGDREQLREAISWMLDHPAERAEMVRKGQAHVREAFDVKRMVGLIQVVYDRTLRQSRDAAKARQPLLNRE